MLRPNRWARVLPAAVALAVLASGCGGGSPSENIQAPLVRAFSPFLSPMDFTGGIPQQNPTFTDGNLVISTDPQYPGKIVVFFQNRTELDPRSVFVGGDPALGIDLSALQVLQTVPGFGNVELALKPTLGIPTTSSDGVHVEKDRIILTPLSLPLSTGQYTVGVFKNLKNTDGDGLQQGPVFHTFIVGNSDGVLPFVVASNPVDGEPGVGAGVPPITPPSGAAGVADIRTSIFGPTTPDVVIRFNEGIDAKTVTLNNLFVEDAGSKSIPPPRISPAPGFPMLKSQFDGATLPSNGHEIIWRADPLAGGFPFGTIIRVTIVGSDGGANAFPIADLSGNPVETSTSVQFQTIALPDLPQNPFPEYAVWWAAADRIGAIDSINQQAIADTYIAAINGFPNPYPFGIPQNVLPAFTDTVANAQHIPGFEPTELSLDCRTNFGTCHTWVYAMSPNSGQLVIVNSRNSLPVAIINTPTPGGISNQTGGTSAADVVVVTNSSANTITIYSVGSVTPGLGFVNGPIFIHSVKSTGNTPRAISISKTINGIVNRDAGWNGPGVPFIFYADFTDGVVNTLRLPDSAPTQQFSLGPNAAPNDVNLTPCIPVPGQPSLMFGAISQGGLPGEGKVAYYLSGPNCITGSSTSNRPDSLVGDLTGFDAPAGLNQVLGVGGSGALFVVAESGSEGNAMTTLGLEVGTINTPRVITRFTSVGANPVAVAHRPPYAVSALCVDLAGPPFLCQAPNPSCWYNNTEQRLITAALDFAAMEDMFVCARGAGQVTIINLTTGARPPPGQDRVLIPGVRTVATSNSQ